MIDSKLYEDIGKYARLYKDYPNVYNPDDPNNRDILIKKNMRLAVDLAVKYGTKYSLDEIDIEELIGQGMVGLCTAYTKYNPDKEGFEGKKAKFSSVAYFWCNALIMAEVKKILDRKTKHCEVVEDVPEPHQRDIEKYEQMFENIGEVEVFLTRLRFGLETGKALTYREIGKITGFRVSLIKKSVNTCLEKMRANAEKYGIKWSDVFSG